MMIKTEFKFLRLLLFFGLSLCSLSIFAQGQGQGETLSVTSTGSLDFGRFSIQSGGTGTITIDRFGNGTVNETGSVIMVNRPSPIVQFNISTKKGGDNKVVTVLANPNPIFLANTSGSGGSLELTVDFSQNSFSVDKDIETIVYMGGVLTVDSGDLPGYYSGTVNIIFAYQ